MSGRINRIYVVFQALSNASRQDGLTPSECRDLRDLLGSADLTDSVLLSELCDIERKALISVRKRWP